jgi:transcriptional regulator with XRE-family HTH domain
MASDYVVFMASGSAQSSEDVALKQAMGRAIAHARIAAGFPTQAAFARAMDVRFQYVSRVEKGEENLSLETLAKMTGILKLEMPRFLARVAEEMLVPSDPPPVRRGRPQAD